MINRKPLCILFATAILSLPYSIPAQTDEQLATSVTPPPEWGEVLAQLKEHDAKVSRELRMIKRDIAALQQAMEEPGMPEVFAGVGYILGLFGIAAFMASRRQQLSTDR